MAAQSLSEVVRRLVDADPCVRECLARGIANYSELARRLKRLAEESAGRSASLEAVKAALLRYASRLREHGAGTPQRKLLEVLAGSALELRTGVTVATVKLQALPQLVRAAAELAGRTRLLFLMQSVSSATIIVSSEHFNHIERRVGRENFIEVYPDQTVLVIASPPSVVETRGFIAHVTGILARNGININQIESVYTDTILVLSVNDAIKAFQLLREAIETAKRSLEEAGT